MKRTRDFPNSPASVTAARHFATQTLATSPRPIVSAVELMVSELATNCVRHADTDFKLSVSATPEQIRVEVSDGGGGHPKVRSPRPTDVSGRGLQLVQLLSEAWGVTRQPGHAGKTVWFTIPAQAAPLATR